MRIVSYKPHDSLKLREAMLLFVPLLELDYVFQNCKAEVAKIYAGREEASRSKQARGEGVLPWDGLNRAEWWSSENHRAEHHARAG